jgi:hypothetical protein
LAVGVPEIEEETIGMTKRTFVDFSFKFGLATAVALMCMAVPAKAVLFTDNFSTAGCGTGITTSASLSGDTSWTVVPSTNDGGTVNYDVAANPTAGICNNMSGLSAYSGHYVDLHGTTTNNVGTDGNELRSTTTFGAGTYVVSFLWGNNGACGGPSGTNCPTNNYIEVYIGTTFLAEILTGSTVTKDINNSFSGTFTVAGAGGALRIFSSGNTGSDSGPMIGGPVTVDVGATGGVPEPASGLLLLLPGLAAFGWRRLRRA